jgi:hypothetical protein
MELTPPDELPEEVTKLGELRGMFRGSGVMMILCWVLGALTLLLGLAVLVGSIVALLHGFFKILIVGLGLLSLSVGLLRKAAQSRGLRVFVCADGLARVRGATVEVMRWDEINVIKRIRDKNNKEIVIASAVRLVVMDRRGRRFVFNETVSQLSGLRRMVEEHTLKLMLAPAIEAFESGAAIGFGDVSVSPEGIHSGRDMLPWDLFENAEVSKGWLILHKNTGKGFFSRVEVTGVTNVHVLLALAEYARIHRA